MPTLQWLRIEELFGFMSSKISCVAFFKLLSLVPQFPHLYNGDNQAVTGTEGVHTGKVRRKCQPM